jgi:hypothetical protein
VAEFVSPALERDLIGHVLALPLQPFQFGAFEGKRRALEVRRLLAHRPQEVGTRPLALTLDA